MQKSMIIIDKPASKKTIYNALINERRNINRFLFFKFVIIIWPIIDFWQVFKSNTQWEKWKQKYKMHQVQT